MIYILHIYCNSLKMLFKETKITKIRISIKLKSEIWALFTRRVLTDGTLKQT